MADLTTLFDLRDGQATPVFSPAPYLNQTRVHQQHCYEPFTDLIYATQVIANGVQLADETEPPPTGTRDARGDIAVNRVDRSGAVTGVMYCRAFDHGNGIGAEYDPVTETTYLWLSYDAEMQEIGSGINAHGRRVVRLPFVDQAIVDVGDPGLEVYDPVPNLTHIQPLLDLENQRMGISYAAGAGTRIAVYDLAAFKAQDFSSPLFDFARPTYPLTQASALYGSYLYIVHGSAYNDTDNPPPPEGAGNAYFTVIDIRNGQAIDRVPNQFALSLEYREPESVYVWQTPDGPVFTFGFATDGPARRMALYQISETVNTAEPIVAALTADPEPGVQLTVSVEDPATIQTWEINRIVTGVRQALFQGAGASLPEVSVWFDSGPPGCLSLTYELIVHRTTGEEEISDSNPITFVPEGGCNQGGRAVGEQDNVLGCAQTYTARLHWRGGALPFESSAMDRLTELAWNRTINDVSEASVTVMKGDLSAECCRALAEAEPWVHELTVYRDGELVWQGPVVRTVARRDSITIAALDVFSWFDHLVNTWMVRYVNATPDSAGRRRGPITQIAANHIRLNVTDSRLGEPDYPGIMDYLIVRNAGLPSIKVEKDGSSNQSIWTAYLGDILRDWTKRGLTWTTVGRSILLRGRPTSATRAQARLTMEDFTGEIEVTKDGGQAATSAFVTTQESQDISKGKTLATGKSRSAYGRLDTLVELQEEDATDADMEAAARDALAGRYPVPTSITVPDGSALAPTAPITLRQLVPGERVDVLAESFCAPILQGFVITDVDVTWQEDQEKVGVTLTPLADIDEELTGV